MGFEENNSALAHKEDFEVPSGLQNLPGDVIQTLKRDFPVVNESSASNAVTLHPTSK